MSTAPKAKSNSAPKIPDREQNLVGPQVIRFDNVSMLRWTLMTHGGYATFNHKDANGMCTWMFAHTGVKIWAILEPKYLSPEHDTRRAQFNLHYKIMGAPLLWEYEEASDMYTTFLAPGDML